MVVPGEECSGPAEEEPGCHFTYCVSAAGDLRQGDILTKSQALSEVLKEIHPHYHRKDDYTHFLILTQTCDLVRRNGRPCKAKYVSVAAIRPVQLALEREVSQHQDKLDQVAGVCRESVRSPLRQFVARILNNNDPEYFYLEPEPTFGLYEPSCAFLRLSVALRAHEHYDKLIAARIMSLTEIFRAKLGWLVGNMYSRVGTEDWAPDHITDTEFNEKADQLLASVVQWVQDEQLKAAKKGFDTTRLDREAFRKKVQETKVPRKKDNVALATRVDGEVSELESLDGVLIRINRPR